MTDQSVIIKHLKGADSVMNKVVNSIPFPTTHTTGHFFHDLMSCIIEQQIHYRSTKKTFHNLLVNAKLNFLTVDNFYLFEEKALANYKMTSQKAETISEIITLFTHTNYHWGKLSNEEIHAILGPIKGMGKKTINLLLMYSLQRNDVFIDNDYHVMPLMQTLYGSKNKKTFQPIINNYKPYRSIAFKYLVDYKTALKKGI